MSKHGKENRDTNRERQPYERPALREFGPVGALTQAGTGTMMEQGNSSSRVHRP